VAPLYCVDEDALKVYVPTVNETSGHVPLAPVMVTSVCTGVGAGGVGVGVGVGIVSVRIVICDTLKTSSVLLGRVPVKVSFVPA
jgi:hypothetical protein